MKFVLISQAIIWGSLSGIAALYMIWKFFAPGVMQYEIMGLPFVAMEVSAFSLMAGLFVHEMKK